MDSTLGWLGRLSLQKKLQILIQGFLAIILVAVQLWLSHHL